MKKKKQLQSSQTRFLLSIKDSYESAILFANEGKFVSLYIRNFIVPVFAANNVSIWLDNEKQVRCCYNSKMLSNTLSVELFFENLHAHMTFFV